MRLNVPFTLGHAGWILGTGDNPAVFDNLMPKAILFMRFGIRRKAWKTFLPTE